MRLFFGERDTPYQEARVVVLPVPYDLSLSFLPGARRGPEAILLASRELEPFLLEIEVAPEEVGIHAAEPVPWVAGNAEESHALIREAALTHLRAGKFLVALGVINQELVKRRAYFRPPLLKWLKYSGFIQLLGMNLLFALGVWGRL